MKTIGDKHKQQIQELTSLEDSKIKELTIQNDKASKFVQRKVVIHDSVFDFLKEEEITNLKEQLKKKVLIVFHMNSQTQIDRRFSESGSRCKSI